MIAANAAATARAEDAPTAPQPQSPPEHSRLWEVTPSEVDQPAPAWPAPPPVYSSETAQPAPAWPPPGMTATSAPRPAPQAGAPSRSGFERRHQVGFQIGGTGLLQIAYRFHATSPIHLEVGMFGADHGANISVGVLVGQPLANRWFPYAGVGGGWMGGFAPRDEVKPCDPPPADCSQNTSETLLYVHLRAGIGVALGASRRSLISLDVGGWYGAHEKTGIDAVGNETSSSGRTMLPMAGLSYFFAL